MIQREVIEGVQKQGANESIRWVVDCTPAPVTVVAVTVEDVTATPAVDVSDDVLSGSALMSATTITLPLLAGLTTGRRYVVRVRYSDGVNTVEPWFRIQAE
jgi:hypothetical protein